MDAIQEQLRKSMLAKRKTMFDEQPKGSLIERSSATVKVAMSSDLSNMPQARFALGNCEESTLNLGSQPNYSNSQFHQPHKRGAAPKGPGGPKAPASRIQSAKQKTVSSKRDDSSQKRSQKKLKYGASNNYSDDAVPQQSHLTDSTFQFQHLKNRVSPVNTVFQKLAMQDSGKVSLTQSSQLVIELEKQDTVINDEQKNVKTQDVDVPLVTQSNDETKSQDHLLISIKPLTAQKHREQHEISRQEDHHHPKQTEISYLVQGSEEEEDEEVSPTITRKPSLPANSNTFQQARRQSGTEPIVNTEMGTQTMAFQSQTNFPVNQDESFHFFQSQYYQSLITQQNQGVTLLESSDQAYQSQTVVEQSSQQKVDPSQIVALIKLDPRLFGTKKKDQLQPHLPVQSHNSGEVQSYACLHLKDLVWIHNHLVRDVIREKRVSQRGRMTSAGLEHRKNKYETNPKLFRNENLQPCQYKRFEANILEKTQIKEHSRLELYRFTLGVLQRGQFITIKSQNSRKIFDRPVFRMETLVEEPQRGVKLVAQLIKRGHLETKEKLNELEKEFQTGQSQYNKFLAQHQHSQPKQLELTPIRKENKSIKKLTDSEMLPATATMSQILTENFPAHHHAYGADESPQQEQLAKVTEMRMSFQRKETKLSKGSSKKSQTREQKSNSKSKRAQNYGNQNLSRKGIKNNVSSFLKVEQVKVNKQNISIGPQDNFNKSFQSVVAVGTQRIDSKLGKELESSKEVMTFSSEGLMPMTANDSVILLVENNKVGTENVSEMRAENDELPSSSAQQSLTYHDTYIVRENQILPLKMENFDMQPIDSTNGQPNVNKGGNKSKKSHYSGSVTGGPHIYINTEEKTHNKLLRQEELVDSSENITAVFLDDYSGIIGGLKPRNTPGNHSKSSAFLSSLQKKESTLSSQGTEENKPMPSSQGAKSSTRLHEKALQKNIQEIMNQTQNQSAMGITGTRVQTCESQNDRSSKQRERGKKGAKNRASTAMSGRYSVIPMSHLEPTQVNLERKTNQKIIPIVKQDVYKQQESNNVGPRWMVPTSKRVRTTTQPRQQKSSVDSAAASQAEFYRTTRSHTLNQLMESEQCPPECSYNLAIDNRNSLNLQKAIDLYYDGELPIGELHNGDLHQIYKIHQAQKDEIGCTELQTEMIKQQTNENTQVVNSSPSPSKEKEPEKQMNNRFATVIEARSGEQTLVKSTGEAVKMKSVFSSVKAYESPKKGSGLLQGSKFRQSEMIGFRKKSVQNSGCSSSMHNSLGSLKEDDKSTERLNKKKLSSNNRFAYVSGCSFQGTYTIETDDSKPGSRKKRSLPHRVDLGTLPNQHTHTVLQEQNSIITQLDQDLNETQKMSQLLSRQITDNLGHFSSNKDLDYIIQESSSLIEKNETYMQKKPLSGCKKVINQDLTQVIMIGDKRTKQTSDQQSVQFSRRDDVLSPKFKESDGKFESAFALQNSASGAKALYTKTEGSTKSKEGVKVLQTAAAGRTRQKQLVQKAEAPTGPKAEQSSSNEYRGILLGNQLISSDKNINNDFGTLLRGADEFEKSAEDSNPKLLEKSQISIKDQVDVYKPIEQGDVSRYSATNQFTGTISARKKSDQVSEKDELAKVFESQSPVIGGIVHPLTESSADNNDHYYKMANSQVHLSRTEQNLVQMTEQHFDGVRRQSTPIILGRLSEDNREASSLSKNRPQSVVMSRLSNSRIAHEQANDDNADRVRENDDEDFVAEIPSDPDQDLTPQHLTHENTFLATAIYENQFREKNAGTGRQVDQRSRSMTDQIHENANMSFAKNQEKSPLLKSTISRQTSNRKTHPKATGGDETQSSRSRDVAAVLSKVSDRRRSEGQPPLNFNSRHKGATDQASIQMPMVNRLKDTPLRLSERRKQKPDSLVNSPSTRPIMKESNLTSKVASNSRLNNYGPIVPESGMSRTQTSFRGVLAGVNENIKTQEVADTLDAKTGQEETTTVPAASQLNPIQKITEVTTKVLLVNPDAEDQADGDMEEAKEFKILREEIEEDMFVEDDLAADEFPQHSQSPIRVQTTTINKSQQQLLNESAASLNNTASLTNQSSVGIGSAAYQQEGLRKRQSRTAAGGRQGREPLKTSQVIMMPIEPMTFPPTVVMSSTAGAPNNNAFTAQVNLRSSSCTMLSSDLQKGQQNGTISANYRPEETSGGSPYANYVQSAEILIDQNYEQQALRQIRVGGEQLMGHPYLVEPTDAAFVHSKIGHMRRPKTSMQTLDSVSKSIKQRQEERKHQVILKRNMSMNRRKSQLMIQSQIDKSRRFTEPQSRLTGGVVSRAQTSQKVKHPLARYQTTESLLSTDMNSSVANQTKNYAVTQNNYFVGAAALQAGGTPLTSTQVQHKANLTQNQNYFSGGSQAIVLQSTQKDISTDSLVDVSLLVKKQNAQVHNRIISLKQINHLNLPNQQEPVDQKQQHNRTQTLNFNVASSTGRREDSPENDMTPVLSKEDTPKAHTMGQQRPGPHGSNQISVISQSGSSVTAIREMRDFMRQNQDYGPGKEILIANSKNISQLIGETTRREVIEAPSYQSQSELASHSKQMMIKAALSGQPASGVGNEIQQKREKMKLIYKAGRRKIQSLMPGTTVNRPARAKSSLLQRNTQKVASEQVFKVQGCNMEILNPQTQSTRRQISSSTPQKRKVSGKTQTDC